MKMTSRVVHIAEGEVLPVATRSFGGIGVFEIGRAHV